MTAPSELRALQERLRKRAEQDRSYAVNNKIVADLLQPQMDAFDARDGHNVYAVRMQLDHRNSSARDNAWADDLENASALLDEIEGLKRALERIAGSHWERQGYCQTDVENVPDLSAEEAMNEARNALSPPVIAALSQSPSQGDAS